MNEYNGHQPALYKDKRKDSINKCRLRAAAAAFTFVSFDNNVVAILDTLDKETNSSAKEKSNDSRGRSSTTRKQFSSLVVFVDMENGSSQRLPPIFSSFAS